MIKVWMAFAVAIMCMVLCSTTYGQVAKPGQWETVVLTDSSTERAEGRFGYKLDEIWTAGALATYYAEEDTGAEWSAGLYAKMTIDPNATLPIADALPVIGDWLSLPDSIQVDSYLIGKFEAIPYQDGMDMALSGGIGAQVGPVTVEWIYQMLESGDSDVPALDSKAVLWFGLGFAM